MDDQANIVTTEQSDNQAVEAPNAAAAPVVVEAPAEQPSPAVDQQATDHYLEERKEKKRGERRGRGGAQARIDQLTKEKAELAKAAEAAKTAPKPAIEIPATRPTMDDFENVNDFHAATHLWAIREEKGHSNGAAAPPAEAPPPPHLQVRKQEFDQFLDKGRRFIAGHPDFGQVMEGAAARGLTLSESARTAITGQAMPEVAYFLAKPENDAVARSIMQMDEFRQVVEVSRLAERLAVNPQDFISRAPTPGIRLSGGNTRSTLPIDQLETDDYIRQRAQEKRAARGRR